MSQIRQGNFRLLIRNLREQHERTDAMSKTGRELLADMGVESTEMKIERLEKQNAALLAACKEALDRWGDYAPPSNSKAYAAMVQVRQAIALAEAPAESQVQEPTR